MTADEEQSLRIGLASPEAYNALGIQFNPALNGLRISVKKRNDGRSFLEVRTERAIQEPFVELVIQAEWAAGKLQREYTFLLDPAKAARVEPLVAATEAAPAQPVTPTPEPAPVAEPTPAAVSAPLVEPAPAVEAPALAQPSPSPDSVTVAKGQTASGIAARLRPAGVSLDQMLVAMLKANPNAFIQGNVNRLKAGAVLQMPSAAAAQETGAAEARRLIAAQSRDFNEFRRRLAGIAPSAPKGESGRELSGQVQTEVADQQTQASAEDKLTLSKGAADTAAQDQLAQERSAADVAQQTAEAARNLEDLNKLQEAVSAATAEPAASGAADPAAAPAETAAAPALPAPAPTEPAASGSALQRWMAHPWALPGAGLLLALLALFGVSRMRKRPEPTGMGTGPFTASAGLRPAALATPIVTEKTDATSAPSFEVSVLESPAAETPLAQAAVAADGDTGATEAVADKADVPPTETAEAPAAVAPVDIDFGDLNLDLRPNEVADEVARNAASAALYQEPLRTKLALAKEFVSIGDATAARAMAQEVLEQGDESLQAEAQALLASLG